MKINLFHLLMICVLMWFVAVATSCAKKKKAHFTKQDGTQVACDRSGGTNCGIWLRDCNDGHEYSCVQNVEYY